MERVSESDYQTILPYIQPNACGTVYPRSIAEKKQYGDIFKEGNSELLWHYCGFAYLFGDCDSRFLEAVDREFLHNNATLSRRFILFTDDAEVIRFFQKKDGLMVGKRYAFTYPETMPAFERTLPAGFSIHAFDKAMFDTVPGRITPRFSWRNAEEFLLHGKAFCVMHGETPAAWAFSAAVSEEEIDIGVETAEPYRHQGLAMLAAEAMLRYCFAQRKRPVWSCDTGNIASQKLAEKLGFERVSEYTTIRKNALS